MTKLARRTRRRQQGTSMIEILVVIVVFLVGILAIVQVFPPGLRVLQTTRNNTLAVWLGKSEMERLKGMNDQAPEAIVPVRYAWDGTQFQILVETNRRPGDFSPPTYLVSGVPEVLIDQTGTLRDSENRALGQWQLFAGPNVMRRVIGESQPVASPRFIRFGTGQIYAGFMALQFAPLVFDPNLVSILQVYGNDLAIDFTSDPSRQRRLRDSLVLLTYDGSTLGLPQSSVRERLFRIFVSYTVSTGGSGSAGRTAILTQTVPADGAPSYFLVNLPGLIQSATGDNVLAVDEDSVRVQRQFENVGDPSNFITNRALRSDAAYQFVVLDPRLGTLAFNPLGSTFTEGTGRGRQPLTARVDYDVLDWRIIRDDFRMPAGAPYQQKLALNSIKVPNTADVDGTTYTGLGFPVPDADGNPVDAAFVVVDRETGSIVLPESYSYDGSFGVVTFEDFDNDSSNGVNLRMIAPGANAAYVSDDVRGRSFRALYRGNNEWAVQAVKAASRYSEAGTPAVGLGQYYVGGTFAGQGLPSRIYFPPMDTGNKVIIAEIWIQTRTGREVLSDQEFSIRPPDSGDPLGLAYVDITEKALAAEFDFSNNYAVRGVRGSSAGVRVFWNPEFFTLSNDQVDNGRRYEEWQRNQRVTTLETFLTRERE